MNTIPPSLALACLAALPAIASDGAVKRDVVAFNATVRVEVDATGKPVKVEAPPDIPDALRGYIEKRVASWQYEPAKQGGSLVAAVTFVRVGACAIPVAEGYRLGLDFKGNGPAIIGAGPWFIPPPRYPTEMQRRAAEGTFKVDYAIQADGTTKITSIEPMEGTPNRVVNAFRGALTDWIEGLRYHPEQVNGEPVATDMSFPVEFRIRTDGARESTEAWRARYKAELQARAMASSECVAASGASGPLPIATNSPVTVIPTPAG